MEWLVPLLFATVLLGELLCSVQRLSQTSDEADHLHAGYRYWQCKDYGFNPEHPPLVKLVAAAPLYFGHFQDPLPGGCDAPRNKDVDFEAARRFLFSTSDPQAVLVRARAAVGVFSLALLICTWIAARLMFGWWPAVIASALLVFEPNLLAHGALVATDAPLCFSLLFAIFAYYLFTERRRFPYVVLCGMATGLTLATKHSGVLLLPMLLSLAVVSACIDAWQQPRWRVIVRNLGAVAAAIAIGTVLLWTIYGFRYAARPNAAPVYDEAQNVHPTGLLPTVIVPELMKTRVLPESYLAGLREVTAISEHGRPTFVLKHIYPTGRWFYFPVAFVIKTTIPFLVLLVAAFFARSFWTTNRKQAAFLLVPPAIYMLVSVRSNLNIGFRHILPVLPFLLLFAAAGAWDLAQRSSAAKYAVALALLLHAATSLHAFPNYLSYANEFWGGPAQVNRYLTDSNSDWGQALLEARDYLASYPNEPCWALFPYHVDIRDYGLRCNDLDHARFRSDQRVPIPTQLTGIFLISGRHLSGLDPIEAGLFWAKPFVSAKPVAIIGGGAMFVYQGKFDMTVPAGIRQLHITQRYLLDGDPLDALQAAERAIELLPDSGHAHAAHCAALRAAGDMQPAIPECALALQLFRRHPEWNAANIENVTSLMRTSGMPIPDVAVQK